MLSVLSCAGCCYCRFSPFVSISIASHHTFRKRNCSKPRFIHECQALFCSSPMIPFEIHIEINTKTSWRHEEDIYNVGHTQRAKSTPNPAQRASRAKPTQPSAPSTAKSHAQAPTRAKPKPTPNPHKAEPNPRPTQHSAPSTAKSHAQALTRAKPHAQPAQRTQHGQIPRPTQPSTPSRAKSAPNPAQRAQHGQIRAQRTQRAHQRVQSLFF